MRAKNLIEGLQILIKYMDNKEGSHVYAHYEEIIFEETDRPVSNTDLKKLSKLGWHQELDAEARGIDYDEFTERYRYPEETMFVVSYYILSNYDPDYKTDEVEV